MSIYATIKCDRCGEEESHGTTPTDARHFARQSGWRTAQGRRTDDICDSCVWNEQHSEETQ